MALTQKGPRRKRADRLGVGRGDSATFARSTRFSAVSADPKRPARAFSDTPKRGFRVR